jgi:hypothetical protein
MYFNEMIDPYFKKIHSYFYNFTLLKSKSQYLNILTHIEYHLYIYFSAFD